MMTVERCYEVLGLAPNAPLEQIRTTYHELVRQWHPDKLAHNPKLQLLAEDQLKEINAAYEILKSFQSSSQVDSKPPYEQATTEKQHNKAADVNKAADAAEQEARRQRQKEEILRVQAAEKRERDVQDLAKRKSDELRNTIFWLLCFLPGALGIGLIGTGFMSLLVGWDTAFAGWQVTCGLSIIGVIWLLHFFLVSKARRNP